MNYFKAISMCPICAFIYIKHFINPFAKFKDSEQKLKNRLSETEKKITDKEMENKKYEEENFKYCINWVDINVIID